MDAVAAGSRSVILDATAGIIDDNGPSHIDLTETNGGTMVGTSGADVFRIPRGGAFVRAFDGPDRVVLGADYGTLAFTRGIDIFSGPDWDYRIQGTGDDGRSMNVFITDNLAEPLILETRDRTITLFHYQGTSTSGDDLMFSVRSNLNAGGGDDIVFAGGGTTVTTGGAPDLIVSAASTNTTLGTAASLDALFDLLPGGDVSDSTIPHATAILNGSTTARTHFYSFTVGPGSIAGLFEIDYSNFDNVIRLYNAAGVELAFNDNSYPDAGSVASVGRDAYLEYTFTTPGTYYIAVEAASGGTLGSAYQLNVSLPGHAVVPSTIERLGYNLDGGDGADVIRGTIGSDRIEGGSGADVATYAVARASTTISTVGGVTTVSSADWGVDTLTGIEFLTFQDATVSLTGGVVTISTSTGADFLLGAAAADWLDGAGGDDVLFGYGGDDILMGRAGNDLLSGGQGADLLDGGLGVDTVSYADAAGGVIIDLANGARSGEALGDSYRSIETFVLTAFGDVFVGSAWANTIMGGGGDDRLTGGGGADILTGGAGADLFVYDAATDSSMATGIDLVTDFQTGVDRIDLTALGAVGLSLRPSLEAGNRTTLRASVSTGATLVLEINGSLTASDLLYTAAPGLTLTGTANADSLIGSFSNDSLTGGAGADTMTGGAGADLFRYLATSDSTAAVQDVITDFATQSDTIDLTSLNATSISVARLNGASVVYAQTPGGGFQLFTAGATLNANDFAYGGAFGVYVIGSETADTIVGSARPDPLVGNGGDDVITGGAGADAIAGGAGRDVFRYVSRGDSNQQTGFDNLYDFTSGEDRIDLTAMAPTSISILRTDNGSSFIYAETAAGVFLTTAAGRAVQATDITYGNGFGIYMVGSGVNDVLVGTSLADPIAGGAGNDTITGGGGADAMFGDGGADTFVYLAASDSTQAASDGIFGFVSGTDKLDLRAVRTGASDTFGIAYLSGGSYLFVDLGGNGTSDLVIGLAGTTLVAGDILWNAGGIGDEPAVKDAGPEVLPVEDGDALFDGDLMSDLAPMTGRFMLDLEGTRGFHGQDWYL